MHHRSFLAHPPHEQFYLGRATPSCWQSRHVWLSQVGSTNEKEPHDNNLGAREGVAYRQHYWPTQATKVELSSVLLISERHRSTFANSLPRVWQSIRITRPPAPVGVIAPTP